MEHVEFYANLSLPTSQADIHWTPCKISCYGNNTITCKIWSALLNWLIERELASVTSYLAGNNTINLGPQSNTSIHVNYPIPFRHTHNHFSFSPAMNHENDGALRADVSKTSTHFITVAAIRETLINPQCNTNNELPSKIYWIP